MATLWYSRSAMMDYIIWTLTILTRRLWLVNVYRMTIKIKHISQKIVWPSYTTLKSIVANNLISNSGINVDGIEQTVYIYGIPKSVLKGKITRVPPNQSPIPCISIPQPIFQYHQKYWTTCWLLLCQLSTFFTHKII